MADLQGIGQQMTQQMKKSTFDSPPPNLMAEMRDRMTADLEQLQAERSYLAHQLTDLTTRIRMLEAALQSYEKSMTEPQAAAY
jgi:hypothetical protein